MPVCGIVDHDLAYINCFNSLQSGTIILSNIYVFRQEENMSDLAGSQEIVK